MQESVGGVQNGSAVTSDRCLLFEAQTDLMSAPAGGTDAPHNRGHFDVDTDAEIDRSDMLV